MCGIAGMIDLSGERAAPIGVVPAMAAGHRPSRPGRGRLPRTPRPPPRQPPALHRRPRGRPAADRERRPHRLDRLQRRTLRLPREAAAARSEGPRLPHAHRHRTHPAPVGRAPRADVRPPQGAVRVLPLGQPHERSASSPATAPASARSSTPSVKHDGTDWLLFASEMKALFASGLVDRKPDLQGLNHIFTFFAMPGPTTVFEGIKCLVPGRYLHFKLGQPPDAGAGHDAEDLLAGRRTPTAGTKTTARDEKKVVDGFEEVLFKARAAAAAGRRAGRVVPLRRRRFEPRRRDGEQGARPADPDVHHLGEGEGAERGVRGAPGREAPRLRAGRRRLRARRAARRLPGTDRRRRVPGDRHVVPRACCTWRGRSTSTATRSR